MSNQQNDIILENKFETLVDGLLNEGYSQEVAEEMAQVILKDESERDYLERKDLNPITYGDLREAKEEILARLEELKMLARNTGNK